ncbi:leucine-rich repeat-containing protein 4C-like [Lytechinus variegatus]|uniref:leucine-rich repeat-containing protein 4C-like n=1 Tax=Lytechinus variegatus TaxID=7654 RepID=UPI001BB1278F|nr:leucine-rich repeat-containing protein 4C-like [Lytechinus variegatus]
MVFCNILASTPYPAECAPSCNCTRVPSNDVCKPLLSSSKNDHVKCICPENGLIPDEFLDVLCLEVEFEGQAVLDSGSFSVNNFSALYGLTISRVQYITPGGFRAVASIKQLFFRNVSVIVFEKGVFMYLERLGEILAGNNNISFLQDGCFEGLTQTRNLNLSYNSISGVSRDNFLGLTMLQTLDLSWNNIVRLEPRTFELMPKLQTLNLASNAIVRIDRGTFLSLNQLGTLNLDGNQINVLPEPQVSESKSHPVIVIIRHNPLQCDCRMNWVNSWIKTEGPQISGSCEYPETLKRITLFEAYKEPMPQCQNNNSKIHVSTGSTAILTCPFVYASWVVPDMPNDTLQDSGQSDNHYFLTNRDSLVVWNAQEPQEGVYTCTTEDGEKSMMYNLVLYSKLGTMTIALIIVCAISGFTCICCPCYFLCCRHGSCCISRRSGDNEMDDQHDGNIQYVSNEIDVRN